MPPSPSGSVPPVIRQVVAVDWSGRKTRAASYLWIARAPMDGNPIILEQGQSREQVVRRLLQLISDEPATLIGLDFAFSFPSWYFDHLGVTDVFSMWERVAANGEAWLSDCPWPFWGRAARKSPTTDAILYRKTEEADGAKSVFQVYYSGAVGTGSIRGMPQPALPQGFQDFHLAVR